MGAAALALHGIHDSVLISEQEKRYNMRYARSKPYSSPTVRTTRLSFILSGRGDHSAPIKI